MKILKVLLLSFFIFGFFACAFLAIASAPAKRASNVRTKEAIEADDFFWKHFHKGDYDKIDEILTRLKSAFLKDPNDATTISHIAFTHVWRLSERIRLANILPNITDDAVLAVQYFDEALRLNPKDARVKGFLADMEMAAGTIFHDEKKVRKGYFLGLEAIDEWPEFNLFTVGYPLSTKKANSEKFKEALEWQWKTLERCAEKKLDRENIDYKSVMNNEERSKKVRKKSVCWNSEIAPHNFEGFFLNMGDMLLKAGKKSQALAIYDAAKLSKTYEQWPYKKILEQRIADAKNAEEGISDTYAPRPMMFNSAISCMACHQSG